MRVDRGTTAPATGMLNGTEPRSAGHKTKAAALRNRHQTKHLTKCVPEVLLCLQQGAGAVAERRFSAGLTRSATTMPRHVKIGEAKTHLSSLLAAVEAGEDLVICRGTTPVAHVTRIAGKPDHAELIATLRRERAKQKAVTTEEILSWRHAGHTR